MLQIWVPDPDEKERYWHTMDEIKTWSEEEQKHFMNNAYLGELNGCLECPSMACPRAWLPRSR